MKDYQKTAAIAFVILLLIFLASTFVQAQDCITGEGWLPADISELPCAMFDTKTMQEGVPGRLRYSMTPDSVVYSYRREGFDPHVIAHRRSADAITECIFVYNGILRMIGYTK